MDLWIQWIFCQFFKMVDHFFSHFCIFCSCFEFVRSSGPFFWFAAPSFAKFLATGWVFGPNFLPALSIAAIKPVENSQVKKFKEHLEFWTRLGWYFRPEFIEILKQNIHSKWETQVWQELNCAMEAVPLIKVTIRCVRVLVYDLWVCECVNLCCTTRVMPLRCVQTS